MRLRTYVIRCDGWWNGEVCGYFATVKGTYKKGAEAEARADGWMVGDKDYCPGCVAEGAGQR